jgi:site-specific DNA-methyltransferase (adenine-specific)
MDYLKKDYIYHGKAEDLIKRIEPNSIALSFWSPPYFVGKKIRKR